VSTRRPHFRDITIKRKIVLIAMLTTLAALVLTTAAYIANEVVSERQRWREDLAGTAAMLGNACSAALAFDDVKTATDMLATLKAKPWIRAASMHREDGSRFAEYLVPGAPPLSENPRFAGLDRTRTAVWRLDDAGEHFWNPIVLGKKQIGVIHVVADTVALATRIRQQTAASLIAFLVAVVAALAFASRLQRAISVPILNMLGTMREVSHNGNYAARVAAWGRDELGQLVDGLNGMLKQIELHVAERARHSEALERQVAERTADLAAAMDRAVQASAVNEARDARLRAQNEALARLVTHPAIHSGRREVALRAITETAAATLGVDRAGVWLFAADRSAIESADVYERSRQRHTAGVRIEAKDHPGYFAALESARSIVANDALTDPRTASFAASYLRPTDIASMLNSVVRHEGRVAGVFCHEQVGAPRRWELDEESFAGSLADIVGLALDACDRRKAREELVAAKNAAEAASKAKSQFLANMSHEIRTPMNGILGMAELLAETSLTARQKNFSDAILHSGEHLLTTINDVLDFSKIEAGRVELESLDFDLREALERTVDLFVEHAGRKGVELALDAPPDLPSRVRGDPGRLRQILMNLVGNAVKFTEHGEVVVRVSVTRRDPDRASFRFEVSDTGIGISDEHQTRLFESFMQADPSMTRRYGGSGLGLAITRELVRLMGGTICLKSAMGKGSTFWFEIPLDTIGDHRKPRASLAGPQGLRVLVVDDNRTNRDILIAHLTAWGLRPVAVEGADAALSVLSKAAEAGEPFRLGLFDLHMPGTDGLALARAIRADPATPSFPIVMLTSGDSASALREARAVGIERYVRKPVRQSDLHECVIGVLGLTPGAEEPLDPPARSPAARPLPAHVLLAEDNPISRDVARAMLERLGCTVEVAVNGRDAVDLALAKPFDVVFMDCQMPEMDGYTASAEIRRVEAAEHRTRRTRIIALTAHALSGDRDKCLAAGMDDYMTKPLQTSGLRRILAQGSERQPSGNPTPSAGNAATSVDLAASQAVAEANPAPSPAGGVPAGDNGVFDRNAVLQRCLGDEELMASMLGVFVRQAGEDSANIQRALAAGDAQMALRVVHRLKGSAANLALERIRESALKLESHVREQGLPGAQEWANRVQAHLDALASALRP
jgi:signal transduction histidine kinase/DNA-binding response OmpR family regulator/HPt (histidine-containing phosphotransfer) domain-containing protein